MQDKKTLANKNAELAEAFREKSRAQQRLQTLYQKLKGRVNAVQVEDAAAHDAENVIHAVTGGLHSSGSHGNAGLLKPHPAHVRSREIPGVYTHQRQGSGSSGGGRPSYGWEPEMSGALPSSRKFVLHV